LTTPLHEHIEKPLHFEFSSPERSYPPQTRLSLSQELTKYQGYELKILLTLPESTTNFDIGMFMIQTKLSYENANKTTCAPKIAAQSNRHAIIIWKSGLQRIIYTLFYSLPLVLGVSTVEEKQNIEVVMFEEFVYEPPREDDFLVIDAQLSDPKIQLYRSVLQLRAQLHGISYYCYHYFYTCLLLGTLCIFFFGGILCCCCCCCHPPPVLQ